MDGFTHINLETPMTDFDRASAPGYFDDVPTTTTNRTTAMDNHVNDAISVIESIAGFDDETTSAGEAWAVVKRRLAAAESAIRLSIDNTGVHHVGMHIPWAELNKLNPIVTDLQARIAELEAEIRTDEYTIADLNHQIEGFKGRIAELEALIAAAGKPD